VLGNSRKRLSLPRQTKDKHSEVTKKTAFCREKRASAGKEIADEFYAQHPARFAPWDHARVIALYPNPLDATAWTVPPTVNKTSGGVSGGDVLSSVGLKHFVAYVKGAAGIRINTTKGFHGAPKHGLFEPFMYINDRFAKTGSGQTQGKHSNKRSFFLRRVGNAIKGATTREQPC
jgi:hypothetical protein